MKNSQIVSHELIDQFGTCLSITCAIHCMVTPFLILIPAFAGLSFLASESTETILLIMVFVLAIGSFCWGYRNHGDRKIFYFFSLAVLFILAGRIGFHGPVETALVVPGAGLIAFSHLLNLKLCRECSYCENSADGSEPSGCGQER